MSEKTLELYNKLVGQCSRFEKKGKSMAYTSANGYMFSFVNKDGEMGIRFSKEVQEQYFVKYKTSYLKSHGAIMKGYIQISNEILENEEELVILLNESFDYVMSLKPK